MRKFRTGDEVVAISGKDKGKRGTIRSMVGDDAVVVEGLNRARKHVRPNPNKNEPGGVVDKDMPIHISNVALFNPATQKADRAGIRILEDGKKVRYFKSNGEVVDA